MAASVNQHRFFHGVLLAEFCRFIGVDVTKDHIDVVKQMLKHHHKVNHVSDLTDEEYSQFINEVKVTLASEWGFELDHEANMDMKDFIRLIYDYDERKLSDQYDTNTGRSTEAL